MGVGWCVGCSLVIFRVPCDRCCVSCITFFFFFFLWLLCEMYNTCYLFAAMYMLFWRAYASWQFLSVLPTTCVRVFGLSVVSCACFDLCHCGGGDTRPGQDCSSVVSFG